MGLKISSRKKEEIKWCDKKEKWGEKKKEKKEWVTGTLFSTHPVPLQRPWRDDSNYTLK
jgi:hypothetical protein